MNTYELSVEAVYQTHLGLRGRSFDQLYATNSDELNDVVMDALRYIKRLMLCIGEPYDILHVGSIKIHPYVIGSIDEEGHCSTVYGMCIFEWKRDTGCYKSVNEQVLTLLEEIKALGPDDWKRIENE